MRMETLMALILVSSARDAETKLLSHILARLNARDLVSSLSTKMPSPDNAACLRHGPQKGCLEAGKHGWHCPCAEGRVDGVCQRVSPCKSAAWTGPGAPAGTASAACRERPRIGNPTSAARTACSRPRPRSAALRLSNDTLMQWYRNMLVACRWTGNPCPVSTEPGSAYCSKLCITLSA